MAKLRSAGAGAFGVPLDVTDGGSVTAAVQLIEERVGRLDVLVNNACPGYVATDLNGFSGTQSPPHYRFGCPAMGRPASGVGMTFSPCRSHGLGGGVTGSGGIDRPLISASVCQAAAVSRSLRSRFMIR